MSHRRGFYSDNVNNILYCCSYLLCLGLFYEKHIDEKYDKKKTSLFKDETWMFFLITPLSLQNPLNIYNKYYLLLIIAHTLSLS